MFNDLQKGTVIRFYAEWLDTYLIGEIEENIQNGYKVFVKGYSVKNIVIEYNDVKGVVDKNKKFEPIIEEEPVIEEEEVVIEEEPVIEEVKKPFFFGLFSDGGSINEKIIENLPNELTIYIPVFDLDKNPISDNEIQKRIIEVKDFMSMYFGEFIVQNIAKSYIDNKGDLIMQKHIQVTAYPNDFEFNNYKRHLINQVSLWVNEWNQNVVNIEYEDVIYHILRVDEMMKNGGELWIQEAVKDMNKSGSVGSFTKQANKEGLTPIEFAKKVLSKPKGYTIKTRRRASFIKNVNPDKF